MRATARRSDISATPGMGDAATQLRPRRPGGGARKYAAVPDRLAGRWIGGSAGSSETRRAPGSSRPEEIPRQTSYFQGLLGVPHPLPATSHALGIGQGLSGSLHLAPAAGVSEVCSPRIRLATHQPRRSAPSGAGQRWTHSPQPSQRRATTAGPPARHSMAPGLGQCSMQIEQKGRQRRRSMSATGGRDGSMPQVRRARRDQPGLTAPKAAPGPRSRGTGRTAGARGGWCAGQAGP